MIKTAQQSLLDFIMDAIPSLRDLRINVLRTRTDDPKTKMLYTLWTNETNKLADRQYRRPVDMKTDDVRHLVSAGYIVEHGSNLKITDKGASVLKNMILKDPTCTFDSGIDKKASADMIKVACNKTSCNRLFTRDGSWYKVAKRIK